MDPREGGGTSTYIVVRPNQVLATNNRGQNYNSNNPTTVHPAYRRQSGMRVGSVHCVPEGSAHIHHNTLEWLGKMPVNVPSSFPVFWFSGAITFEAHMLNGCWLQAVELSPPSTHVHSCISRLCISAATNRYFFSWLAFWMT